ncbi:alkaline phosphatase family protein [Kitasatospora xanthocidica]|uniref:alkaline phosphatase family protein n=1 Tax=Kitasatospora xanthocidica TaxID=83382 RepID=UPI0036F0B202
MSEPTRRPVAVLSTAGLTPGLLRLMPHLRAVGEQGFAAPLDTVLPAVASTAQATFATGLLPRDHGAVGSGWYLRDQGRVMVRGEFAGLVSGETVWQAARAADPRHTAASVHCDWSAGAEVDLLVAPSHRHRHDGRLTACCDTVPAGLRAELAAELGAPPLVRCGGGTAGLEETHWITGAARHVVTRGRPDLLWVQIPYLDHELQRGGPVGPQAEKAAAEVDAALAPLLGELADRGTTVLVLSGHAVLPVCRPVPLNRELRRAGLVSVGLAAGKEYLRPWTSRAFAVTDRQAAHVYVADPADLERTRRVLGEVAGVDEVLDRAQQADFGLDHPNGGELLAIAEPDAWFSSDYWLDEALAPDFGRDMAPEDRPGTDPTELFLDAGAATARIDPLRIRGSHGRLPEDGREGPLLLCSDPAPQQVRYHATEVKDLILRLNGLAR